MNYATAFIIAIALLCSTAAAAPLVTYESPCECRDNHGKQRWAEKNFYAFYAIAVAISLPFVWAAVRETKGKTLEQMKEGT